MKMEEFTKLFEASKLTRQQLAKKLNVPVERVWSYQGGAVPIPANVAAAMQKIRGKR